MGNVWAQPELSPGAEGGSRFQHAKIVYLSMIKKKNQIVRVRGRKLRRRKAWKGSVAARDSRGTRREFRLR